MTKRRIVRSILSVFLSLVLIISGFLPGMPFVSTVHAETATKTITPGTDDAKTGTGTMEISLTIKKTPAAGDFTFTPPTSPMYDGQPKAATVTTEAEGMGEVTVEYYNGDTKLSGAPTAEGTYKVKINVAEGDGYKAATGITADSWTFTILPMQKTMTITLVIHGHEFTYGAEGATITATCGSTVGNCDLTDKKVSLTLNAPEKKKDTDSLSASATLDAEELAAFNKATGLSVKASDIEYYKGETKLDAAPTEKGDYTAKLTVGTGDNKATASVDYSIGTTTQTGSMEITLTIAPAEVKTAPTANELKFEGTEKKLVTAGEAKVGTMQYQIGESATTAPTGDWSDTVPNGKNAGTYYVWYRAYVGEKNFTEAECVTSKILAPISQTVTFKVVNGSWDTGEGEAATADKTVTLTGYEGDTLKLTADQIPAVGSKPNANYKSGSWDVTPSTDKAISSNVTYTYTYVADSSGGSSDSGSGDSSGGSSDSGSGSSSSGSTDSGSGSSSGGSSDSGNTSGGTSSGSSDNTNTNTDTSAKVPYDDVPISTGSVKDITGTAAATAESNPFETKIENNNNLANLLSLTDAEVAQGVNVWLDIQDMSSSVPQTDKNLIQDKSGDYTVGLYLDINLFKKVGSNDATKVTETNGKVKASIVIPESLWKSGRTFEIIRVHDGVATAIAGTYDENTHVFTFETDKFSTYALAYKDPASSSDSGTTSDSSSSNSSNSTQSTAPKTGDPNDIRVWYLLLIASLGGLGFLGYSKKKKVND